MCKVSKYRLLPIEVDTAADGFCKMLRMQCRKVTVGLPPLAPADPGSLCAAQSKLLTLVRFAEAVTEAERKTTFAEGIGITTDTAT